MRLQLDWLERHGELVDGVDRYGPAVRRELLAMSAAAIDRYLKPAKATDQIRGVATTKPSVLLRSSIKIRKAGDEVESEPGFFEGDTVARCGPTLKGEFARTLNLTDVYFGWVFTRAVRNNAHVHILGALKAGVEEIPFEVTGPIRRTIRRPSSRIARTEPALAAGERPVQLPDPDEETGRVRLRPQWQTQASLRHTEHSLGPVTRRTSARTRTSSRTTGLPRLAEPRSDRPPDR